MNVIYQLSGFGCAAPAVLLLQVTTYALHVLHTVSRICTGSFLQSQNVTGYLAGWQYSSGLCVNMACLVHRSALHIDRAGLQRCSTEPSCSRQCDAKTTVVNQRTVVVEATVFDSQPLTDTAVPDHLARRHSTPEAVRQSACIMQRLRLCEHQPINPVVTRQAACMFDARTD